MAKYKKDKPKAVVDGKEVVEKSKRKLLPRFTRHNVKLLAIVVFVGLVLISTFLIYRHYKNRVQTVTIDGKTYKLHLLTTPDKVVGPSNSVPVDTNKQVQTLEAKIAKDPSYQNYVALAQLYSQEPNSAKAIANYRLAKAALDPKSPNYQLLSQSIDNIIKSLQ